VGVFANIPGRRRGALRARSLGPQRRRPPLAPPPGIWPRLCQIHAPSFRLQRAPRWKAAPNCSSAAAPGAPRPKSAVPRAAETDGDGAKRHSPTGYRTVRWRRSCRRAALSSPRNDRRPPDWTPGIISFIILCILFPLL